MSLSPMCHCSPTDAFPLPAQRAPPPPPVCPRCHAVSQINVEILTSDGPGRHRSSGGRGANGRRVLPIIHPTAAHLASCLWLPSQFQPKLNLGGPLSVNFLPLWLRGSKMEKMGIYSVDDKGVRGGVILSIAHCNYLHSGGCLCTNFVPFWHQCMMEMSLFMLQKRLRKNVNKCKMVIILPPATLPGASLHPRAAIQWIIKIKVLFYFDVLLARPKH